MDEASLLKLTTEVYADLFGVHLKLFVNFSKTIAAIFIGVNLAQKLMANYSSSGMAFKKTDEKGFSPQDISAICSGRQLRHASKRGHGARSACRGRVRWGPRAWRIGRISRAGPACDLGAA